MVDSPQPITSVRFEGHHYDVIRTWDTEPDGRGVGTQLATSDRETAWQLMDALQVRLESPSPAQLVENKGEVSVRIPGIPPHAVQDLLNIPPLEHPPYKRHGSPKEVISQPQEKPLFTDVIREQRPGPGR